MAAANPTLTLNDGNAIPQLGLGVWQTPAEDAADVVRSALDAGYLHIDTAAGYSNEEGVGEAIEGRDDVFVTTKLRNEDQGYDNAMRAFDASSRKLRRDVVDLYLIHWPSPRRGLYRETWKALVELQKSGRVRSIGVSNFNVEHLEDIIGDTGVVPVLNQIELHPDFQQTALRAFHAEHDIKTESWSPLGQGQLLANPEIGRIAKKHDKTPAQAIIRWHLDNGLVVIPKSVKPERIRENFDVFDFTLDEDDLAALSRIDSESARIGPNPATATF
jgi:2,5-diketo-D-gluconate reductase A